MTGLHHYTIALTWTGNQGRGTSGYRDYSRDHEVSAEGPAPLAGSSDPAFHGDRTRWSPEQLLVAALSQCHMLWYLHLCIDVGVVVTDYVDEATGTMVEERRGGRFTEVVLRPQVTVAADDMMAAATRLHADAHQACFIANSVNFPVRHEPIIHLATVSM
jgi:organic hydroperoxide reductase OsmC/OhrA